MRYIVRAGLALAILLGGVWGLLAWYLPSRAAPALLAIAGPEAQMGSVRGFPLAVETELRALDIRRESLAWQAETLDLSVQLSAPTTLNLIAPTRHRLTLFGQESLVQQDSLRGQVTLGFDGVVTAGQVDLAALTLLPALGLASLGAGAAALTQTGTTAYDVTLDLQEIAFDPELRALLDPTNRLPATIAHAKATATVDLTAPISLRGTESELTRVTLQDAQLRWGDLTLDAEGRINRDTQGRLTGDITLATQDWRVLHGMLVAAGALAPDVAQMSAMFLAAQSAPGAHDLTLALNLRDGGLWLGPFRLADLPQL